MSGKDLTDLAVKQTKPKDTPYKLRAAQSLFLLVKPNGSKYWRFSYRFNNKQKTLALGTYPDISLSKAKALTQEARTQVAEGLDPADIKKHTKMIALEEKAIPEILNSFKEVAIKWWKDRKLKKRLSEPHANKILNYLEKDVFIHLANTPIAEITTPQIRHAVRSVEERGAHDVASRELQYIKSIFNYAIEWGYATYNPAQPLSITKPNQQHRPALKLNELPLFFLRLNESTSNPMIISAVKLCIYTFSRPETIRFARWEDFDLTNRTWNVPAQYMKMKTEHIVPMAPQVVTLLEKLHPLTGHYEFLFYNPETHKPISENTMNLCINRLGYKGIATPSGFRTTACSFLNEQGFNFDAIERQMAHMERNKVRAAYIHHAQFMEERIKMMDFWGSYLEKIETTSNIIPANFTKKAR